MMEYLGKGDNSEDQRHQGDAWDDTAQDAAMDGQMTYLGRGSRALKIEMPRLKIVQEVHS